MDRFVMYVAGLEQERVERILRIGKNEGIVKGVSTEPAGSYEHKYGRLKYTITTDKRKSSISIRRRVGTTCHDGVYHRVDEHDHYVSKAD